MIGDWDRGGAFGGGDPAVQLVVLTVKPYVSVGSSDVQTSPIGSDLQSQRTMDIGLDLVQGAAGSILAFNCRTQHRVALGGSTV